jgi:hypothetical protein
MRRWHEDLPVMVRRRKRELAAGHRRWWWRHGVEREVPPLGRYRKQNPYAYLGCRCSWCHPEQLRRRATEKRKAIQDSLSY